MAERGWYPDPSGQPGHYRYWDGNDWSETTSTDPTVEPPAQHRRKRPRRYWPLVLLIFAVAMIVLILVVSTLRPPPRTGASDPGPPISEVSGWDDSQPLPSASPTVSASPSAAASPTPTPQQFPQPGDSRPTGGYSEPSKKNCTGTEPDSVAKHPHDGLVHGGGLQFEPVTGKNWFRGGELGWGWAYDLDGVYERIDYGHNALLWVGAIRAPQEPETPKAAAQRVMACLIKEDADQGLVITGIDELISTKTTVDGHDGWLLRTAVGIDDLQHGAVGRLQHLIVVDTGDELSFFIGSIPYPDPQRIERMEQVAAGLSVS